MALNQTYLRKLLRQKSFSYDEIRDHTDRHNIKRWLKQAAEQDGAHTIYAAIERQSSHRLQRKLAEILTS